MTKKLTCIMLVDDNDDDNYFHERAIKQVSLKATVITKTTGQEGLTYLKLQKYNNDPQPDLIFLDINMPGMNGWEFLQEYNQLDKKLQSQAIIIMLTTSEDSKDMARASSWNFVSDFITKPLTKEKMNTVSNKFFN
jgi:CheY-like chemotaxis protein